MSHPDTHHLHHILPTSITEFRGYTEPSDQIEIPEVGKNRKLTDIPFLIVCTIFLLITICIIVVGARETDYNRFLNGYDECGNTCGRENKPIKGIDCSGKDLRDKPIMEVKYHRKKKTDSATILPKNCVQECALPNKLQFHRCFPENKVTLDKKSNQFETFSKFVDELKLCVPCICAMLSIGLISTLGIFICLRNWTLHTLQVIMILQTLCLLGYFLYVLGMFFRGKRKPEAPYIEIILPLCTTVIFWIFSAHFMKRIELVSFLFEQGMEVVFRIPLLLIVPLLTIILLSAVITGTAFLTALLSTNQNLVKSSIDSSTYVYEISNLAGASIGFLILTALWIISLANGCQCMIVSGAVAAGYFATDKTKLRYSALMTSTWMLWRFHMGTVCFGSVTISPMTIVRFILYLLQCLRRRFKICFKSENSDYLPRYFVSYFAKRGYIETAMHGKPFYTSGRRAARLLWNNSLDRISLDIVADYIILSSLTLVILIATSLGMGINSMYDLTHYWKILAIGAGATGILVFFFMEVLNVAVETIYLCLCEEKLFQRNDISYALNSRFVEILKQAHEIDGDSDEEQ